MLDDAPRPEMSVEEFRLLAELVYAHCGILLREESLYLVERRLAPRLAAVNLTDFGSYYRYLRFDPGGRAELECAIEALTTNETYFFREPHQLKAFREEILPLLAAQRERSRRLRVWSAGCSSGEEAYTIAILLRECELLQGWDLEVFGTDISRRVIAAARKGVYGRQSLRETSPEMIERCFRPEEGRWAVRDEVRALVSFGQLNLLDENRLGVVGRADVIFCRNVMIYFDLAARRRLLRNFHGALADGGFLLLGHSESLINVTADFELVHLKNDLVYRKPAPAGAEPRG